MKTLLTAAAFVILAGSARADVTPPPCATLADGAACTTDDGKAGACAAGTCVAAAASGDGEDEGCAAGGVAGGLAGLVVALGALARRRA